MCELWCGTTQFIRQRHHVTLRKPYIRGVSGTPDPYAKYVTIGDGVELRLTPDIGPGELGLYSTRDLPKGTFMHYEGMQVDARSTDLLQSHKSHAICFAAMSRRQLIGVRVSPNIQLYPP